MRIAEQRGRAARVRASADAREADACGRRDNGADIRQLDRECVAGRMRPGSARALETGDALLGRHEQRTRRRRCTHGIRKRRK
ncbi:hypothetical protein [Burkholderia thailandensis]|uniref:hypothetical protein n=1 Tax=Burkholderia thailandensis TaxID=57975 RepID=UPI0022AC4598|nr:hypothetical protein [Burkholderia thailandensis]MCZ2901932.1 hypothetical protein [Burkholderia thailandensis]MDD1482342.1 hypothetical protein [Burkholderia thailandensis]MDD1486205.1 hypothetical protein [Burkholderia thailandensis]MDD1491982.1 hypothetical protein [Burkholderia thailandensis]